MNGEDENERANDKAVWLKFQKERTTMDADGMQIVKKKVLAQEEKEGCCKVRTRWKGDLGTTDEGSTMAETDRSRSLS